MTDILDSEITWLKAEENPWKVPVLDLRPVTSQITSYSEDPEKAKNAISYGGDDGLSFSDQKPPNKRKIKVSFIFPTDGTLFDGVLFVPSAMEDKWAVFYHDKKIIFVRSWLREVQVVAQVIQKKDSIEITDILGTFVEDDESPKSTELYFNFLMRNLVYNTVYPVPISKEMAESPQQVPMWCFSNFGRISLAATHHQIPNNKITSPLRSTTLFHIAVARGAITSVKNLLEKGIPIDLLAKDGFSPFQWASGLKNFEMMDFLLHNGAHIDCPSIEGTTALMSAVQEQNIEVVEYLIEKGADVNKGDNRGFTSLHRSAEMGNIEITSLLLKHRADPECEAQGHSPLSLAIERNHTDIIKMLQLSQKS